jgi:MFS family permease
MRREISILASRFRSRLNLAHPSERAILVGHVLFVGILGNGALYSPLLVYISRWFDRRRGTALALIWSGQYMQVGAEAIIPATPQTGRGYGGLVQLHFYLDDIFPTIFGKPAMEW